MLKTTSDRGQTLHTMNIKKLHICNTSILLIITNNLKTTKRLLKLKIVKYVNFSDPALDVCANAKRNFLETSKLSNENHDYLFLSFATHKPVTKVPLARWLKTILSLSRIDTKVFMLTYIEVLHYPAHISKEYLSPIIWKLETGLMQIPF